jgi:hypothetical protein
MSGSGAALIQTGTIQAVSACWWDGTTALSVTAIQKALSPAGMIQFVSAGWWEETNPAESAIAIRRAPSAEEIIHRILEGRYQQFLFDVRRYRQFLHRRAGGGK